MKNGHPRPATEYFTQKILSKRPYLRLEWIEQVLSAPEEMESQADGRIRFWGYISSAGRYLRVVTLADGETLHNAFFDRGYKPK